MNDLISREWLKTAIHNFFYELTHIPEEEDIQAYINAAPSVKPQEPRWIPVSERLPKDREWYLVVFKEKDTGYQLIPRVADYIGMGENKWQIIDEEGLCQEYRDILECIAWMPLPKPYETQKSEE